MVPSNPLCICTRQRYVGAEYNRHQLFLARTLISVFSCHGGALLMHGNYHYCIILYNIDNSASNRPDPAAGSAGNKAPNSPCPSQVGTMSKCLSLTGTLELWNYFQQKRYQNIFEQDKVNNADSAFIFLISRNQWSGWSGQRRWS